MIIRRDNMFQDVDCPVKSRYTLDGDYTAKPRYSIAGRMFSEYGSRGTGLTRSIKIGYGRNGNYVNDYRYNISNDTDAQLLIKDIMNSINHNEFSKCMFNLLKHMLRGTNLISNCAQMSSSVDKDVSVTDTLDRLSIKDTNGNILVKGIDVWDNMVSNVDKIDTQIPYSLQTEYMIYDAKTHILNKMCLTHKLSTFIAASDLSYTNMKSKGMCDKIYRSRLRVPVVGSSILYGLSENYTEITSINDALYKCDEEESVFNDKHYHDVILTDLICGDTAADINITHTYNSQVDERNGYTDITALGHKARQIFILECVLTGRSVEAVNMLIGNVTSLDSRLGISENYVKEMILNDDDHVISDMYGIADWTIRDKIKEEMIESNSNDKDIYWINTFVKWFHIINTCNTILNVVTIIKDVFMKKKIKKTSDESSNAKHMNISDIHKDNNTEWVM